MAPLLGLGRGLLLANPDIVRDLDHERDDEMIAAVNGLLDIESVVEVIAARGMEVDVIK
jgi:hypothetical protein